MIASGIPELAGTFVGRFAGPTSLGVGRDRYLHRVVVPVVAALDLDDEVPARDRPHEMDGVHRRLGPRVAKAPQRLPETSSELLCHDDRVLGGLGEVRAPGDLGPHRLDDRGVCVPGEAGSVATVKIDVLGPVDVVDLGAGPMAEPDGLRTRDLPARGHAAGERPPGALDELARPGLALEEQRLLLGHDRVEPRSRDPRTVDNSDYHVSLRSVCLGSAID